MTTQISGPGSGQGWSPLQRMQGQLQRAVTSGTVKADDQDALSAAITDIGAQLQANAASAGTRLDPQGARSTIDSLISDDVSSGKLTADQASELKSVFAQAAQHMHGHGHRTKAPTQDDADSNSDDATDAATPVAASSFMDFLQKLETSIADSVSAITGTSSPPATGTAQASTGNANESSASQASSLASGDPKQLMLGFIKQLESLFSNSNTYSSAGSTGTTTGQAVLVNALA